MKLLWGDLHNHCGITYGFGSLENALERARSHLDFCAVTGHAMWHDIYERNEDTDFIVDFHLDGFRRLADNWDTVRLKIAAANSPELVTFQGYEMHSSYYGDHHIISPDDALPLIDSTGPADLLGKVGCDAMMIAHHIGYSPGYRGIRWEEFDSSVTPNIEVVSKHGCAMRETAPYPYYHTMGPRDGRNTVSKGLRMGHRFGFIGSTDHHAGYPGSYGDGKLAVWADEKTRRSIWKSLKERRVYAVTGDRIECRFSVDDGEMGEIIQGEQELRKIRYSVRACYPIDKIIVYKNQQPIHIINGEDLKHNKGKGKYKVRIETGWGFNWDVPYKWLNHVRVSDGRIISVEPCFRGSSILAPTESNISRITESVNDIDNRILSQNSDCVIWQCFTLANPAPFHATTCSVIIEIDGRDETVLEADINGNKFISTLTELCDNGYTNHVKPYVSNAFKVHPAIHESIYEVEREFSDKDGRPGDFYHMEVSQKNGCWAFITPVFFD